MTNRNLPPMTCQDCANFDTTVHTAAREYHVGFCRKFNSTEFKITTACGQFLHNDLPTWAEVVLQPKTNTVTQTHLDL